MMSNDDSNNINNSLASVLRSYGFILGDKEYSLTKRFFAGPDKSYYFFAKNDNPTHMLVLLTEDYVTDLDYVKRCFSEELNARLVTLHKVLDANARKGDFHPYDVHVPPFDYGFLATIIPNDSNKFWAELRERLDRLRS